MSKVPISTHKIVRRCNYWRVNRASRRSGCPQGHDVSPPPPQYIRTVPRRSVNSHLGFFSSVSPAEVRSYVGCRNVPKRDVPLQTTPGLSDAVGKSETECVCYWSRCRSARSRRQQDGVALLCLHGNGRDCVEPTRSSSHPSAERAAAPAEPLGAREKRKNGGTSFSAITVRNHTLGFSQLGYHSHIGGQMRRRDEILRCADVKLTASRTGPAPLQRRGPKCRNPEM
jgi:hypothetical protein